MSLLLRLRHLTLSDPDYPRRLRVLKSPPPSITVAGSLEAATTVAIVGTRKPIPAAAAFAARLAGAVARRGAVVVSGGAVGIDAMAHEGALAGGGRTWVVAGTGQGVQYPKEHGPLFERIVADGGAIVWPFAPGTPGHPSRFLMRNGVLVALSDLLVIVQARIPSGALNAALWARRLNRPRWVVCPAPWEDAASPAYPERGRNDPEAFAGCLLERGKGARALTSVDYFLDAIGMPEAPPPAPRQLVLPSPRTPEEARVIGALAATPRHVDEVVVRCGLTCREVMTALLTLALDDVLVEGPEGFFRLQSPP